MLTVTRWRRFWTWLHEPPRHLNPPVSAFLWTAPSIVIVGIVSAVLGPSLLGVSVTIGALTFGLGLGGFWLRTGRHYHPLREIRVWLRSGRDQQ